MAAIRVMTAREVARRLRVSQRSAQRYADDGRLTPVRRSPLLFDAAEVDRLAAELAEELKAKAADLAEEAS